jgi:toxin FitB
MTSGWLLDTNIIFELGKGARAHPRLRAWAEAVPPIVCYLSVVTVAEIRFGIARVDDPGFRGELEAWLVEGVRVWFGGRILAVDEDVIRAWRDMAANGRKSGYTYSQPDALIAATALVHGLSVVTRNTADFERAGVALVNPWDEGTTGLWPGEPDR